MRFRRKKKDMALTCEVCGRAYTFRGSLQRHHKAKHAGSTGVKCRHCDLQCLSPEDHDQHVLNEHSDKRKNGDLKSVSLCTNTPPPERKSKFSAFGRIFKPWKWKRKKKRSEKIEKTAVELERKISVRSTREDLIKKGVLKEVDTPAEAGVPEADTALSEGTDNEQNPVVVEQLEAVKESNDEPQSESGESRKPVENGSTFNGGATSVTEAEVEDGDQQIPSDYHNHTTITTQADITPTSTKPAVTLSATLVRPMVFIPATPPATVQKPPTPPPQTVATASVESPKEVHATVTETSSWYQREFVHVSQDTINTDDAEESPVDEDGDYDNIVKPGVYREVPSSEPNLMLQPKRSALKLRGVAVDGTNSSSSVTSQHLESVKESPGVSVVQPTFSPFPTPTGTGAGRLRARVAFGSVHGGDSDSENIPPPPPPVYVRVPDPNPPDYDNLPSDESSDDEEIKYRDDEEELMSSLAVKVARQDSLARFLSNRPSRKELVEKNIIPGTSEQEKEDFKKAIGNKLVRRLSLRPSQEELQQRNILHMQSNEEVKRDIEEKKRYLIRKLSFRPSIEELKERKIIKFSDYVEVTDCHEYDRRADKPWTRLTPKDKAAIRKELNEFKSKEMDVHDGSKHLTRFHRP